MSKVTRMHVTALCYETMYTSALLDELPRSVSVLKWINCRQGQCLQSRNVNY